MRSVLDIVFKVLGALAAFFILATLTIEVVGIALRMVGFSMAGSDAYAGYFLAAGSFLALGYALREGDHIRVTLILQRLRGRTRWWMEVLCLVIASALSVYFAYFAAKLVWGSYAFNDISQNVDATPLGFRNFVCDRPSSCLAVIDDLIAVLRGQQRHDPVRTSTSCHARGDFNESSESSRANTPMGALSSAAVLACAARVVRDLGAGVWIGIVVLGVAFIGMELLPRVPRVMRSR